MQIPNHPELDYAKDHREAMVLNVYDAVTIPSQSLSGSEACILSEEKRICNKLRLLIRSPYDIECGLVRSWRGPRSDSMVLL